MFISYHKQKFCQWRHRGRARRRAGFSMRCGRKYGRIGLLLRRTPAGAKNFPAQRKKRIPHAVPRGTRFPLNQRTFLLSAPGVVTMTFSGVMTSAPLAVAAPLNIFSTIALNVFTISPSVSYTAVPLI